MRLKVRRPWPRYLLVALVSLGLVVGVQQAYANNHDGGSGLDTIVDDFYADSGDICGKFDGTFAWTGHKMIKIVGTVSDRATGCAGRKTTATVTVHLTGEQLTFKADADNGNHDVSWLVDQDVSVDHVVVQVCRIAMTSGLNNYCGQPKTYFYPGIG